MLDQQHNNLSFEELILRTISQLENFPSKIKELEAKVEELKEYKIKKDFAEKGEEKDRLEVVEKLLEISKNVDELEKHISSFDSDITEKFMKIGGRLIPLENDLNKRKKEEEENKKKLESYKTELIKNILRTIAVPIVIIAFSIFGLAQYLPYRLNFEPNNNKTNNNISKPKNNNSNNIHTIFENIRREWISKGYVSEDKLKSFIRTDPNMFYVYEGNYPSEIYIPEKRIFVWFSKNKSESYVQIRNGTNSESSKISIKRNE